MQNKSYSTNYTDLTSQYKLNVNSGIFSIIQKFWLVYMALLAEWHLTEHLQVISQCHLGSERDKTLTIFHETSHPLDCNQPCTKICARKSACEVPSLWHFTRTHLISFTLKMPLTSWPNNSLPSLICWDYWVIAILAYHPV